MPVEPAFSSHGLLESVIGLTGQRDQQSLESCLLDTMCEVTAASWAALYTLVGEGADATLVLSQYAHAADCLAPADEAASRTPSTLALQQAARAFRQSQEGWEILDASHSHDGGVRMAYPVIGGTGQLTGILAVEYPGLADADHRLISAFLRIYQNYQALLNESQRDRLTNLLNRKTFDDRVNRILAELRLNHQRADDRGVYSLAILDIDHFKKINDTFGHLYGDEVLLLFSQIMQHTFRSEDLLFRFGGEEFVVLLKTSDLDAGMQVLERFRRNVEAYTFPQVGKVTVSGGCVGVISTALPTTLFDRADQALYYAKAHGRNQIHLYDRLVAEGKLSSTVAEGSVDLF